MVAKPIIDARTGQPLSRDDLISGWEPITRKQLEKFVAKRNVSAFQTNLQFWNDADACGFDAGRLGQPRKFDLGGFTGYEWRVRVKGVMGPTILVEFGRHLYLAGGPEDEQAALVGILSKAVFEAVEVAA